MWQDAERRRQLESIRKLRDGWDGADAASVSAETIVHCEALLTQLSTLGLEPDFITPTPAGTVDFEWERFLGRASLEIGEGNFGFYTSPRIGHPIMLGGLIEDMDAEEIDHALQTIASGSLSPVASGEHMDMGVPYWDAESSSVR